jgi:hypothetical protein
MPTPAKAISKRIGPLPAWAWAVSAIVVYFLYKRFAAGGTSAAATSPASVATSTQPFQVSTGGSAPASGQGSAVDNVTASLLAAFGQNLVDVNSNLVTGLLGSQSTIEGLGTEALRQSGAAEQAILYNNYAGNTSGGSVAASQPATSTTHSQPLLVSNPALTVFQKELAAHQATVDAQGYWTAGF